MGGTLACYAGLFAKIMKKRIFNWRVKGSLIVTAALVLGAIILAFALYGAEPGSELWELRTLMGGG